MTQTEDWIRKYLDYGFTPLPITPGTKKPIASGWEKFSTDRFDSTDEFIDVFGDNYIALLLGDPSGGLVDIDLDCPEAVRLGSMAMPSTASSVSRGQEVPTHYWFRVLDGITTTKYVDPVQEREQAKARARGEESEDRSVILEIRSTGGQTLVEPSLHPTGKEYKWISPLDNLAEITSEELKRECSLMAAAILLGRYWPTRGNRHNAAVALSGALAQYEYFREGQALANFMLAVLYTANDTSETQDRLNNIDTTFRALDSDRKTQGWPTLGDIYDHADARDAAWKAREWIEDVVARPEEEPEDHATFWTDLGQLMQDEPEPIEFVVPNMVVRGLTHLLIGKRGSGKSLVTLGIMKELIERGRRVVYLDEENGIRQQHRRLHDLGFHPKLLSANARMAIKQGYDWSKQSNREFLLEELDAFGPDLVIFDSTIDLLSDARISINDNDAVAQFYKEFFGAFEDADLTVLAHDHLPVSGDQRAKGSGEKEDLGQIVWFGWVPTGMGFDRSTSGEFHLRNTKDRTGELPDALIYDVLVKPGQPTNIRQRVQTMSAGQANAPQPTKATGQGPTFS